MVRKENVEYVKFSVWNMCKLWKSESYFDKTFIFWIIFIQNIDLAVTKNMMIN